MVLPESPIDLSFINALDLRYGNELYQLTEYDIHNITVICETILEGKRDQVILGPTSISTMLLGSVICAIAFIKQSFQSQSDVYKLLKKGDIVQIYGKQGEFIGVETFEGSSDPRPKIKIRFRDLIYGCDLEEAWRLTRCAAGTKRIDKFGKTAQYSKSPRYILKELLGLKKKEMPPVLNIKLPVVADKKDSLPHYSKLFIGDLPCASVLPAGYYSSRDRYERVGKDPLHREPILCFTSNIEVASDISRNHKGVKGIIVCSYRKLRGNLSHIVNLQANNKRTVLLTDIHKIDREDINKLNTIGFDITVWFPAKLKEVNVSPCFLSPSSSNPLEKAKCILHNAAHGRSKSICVASNEGEQISLLRDKLYQISKITARSDDVNRFLGCAYGLLMQLACLPFSLEQLELMGYSYKPLLCKMEELFFNMYTAVSEDVVSQLGLILKDINRCVDNHRHKHPKHMTFCEAVLKLNSEDNVLVRNNKDKHIVGEWIAENGASPRVLTLHQVLSRTEPTQNTQNSLSVGWYGYKHAMLEYSGFYVNNKMILYPFEQVWMDINRRNISSYMQRTIERPELKQRKTGFISQGIEELINQLTAEWEWGRSQNVNFLSDSDGTEAIAVEFEEDSVAFLTAGYNCRCLDEENETIILKKVSELGIGDILVFVKDSTEDIFDKLTTIVKEANPDIKKQVELTEVWRHAFRNYIESHNISISEFQHKLKQAGVKREVATIRTWQRKDCIGPEDDAIRAIAQITQDPELLTKLDDVVAACRNIRSLHIKLGRYLASSIVSSIAGDMIIREEPMLQQITNDLTKYVEILTVREVASEQVKVPLNKINRPLHKFFDI